MKITKQYLKEVLHQTLLDFEQYVMKLDHPVELSFIDKESFMESVKNDPLIQQQILLGIYKNIEKEYPNFAVVYAKDKNPMLKIFQIPYKITICFELAKDILKPFSKQDVTFYLKRVLAHELTHLFEEDLIKKKSDIWKQALQETHGNEEYAKEIFAETIADQIGNPKTYQKIFDSIWGLIHHRVKKLENK